MMNSFKQNHSDLLSSAYSKALSSVSNIEAPKPPSLGADAYNIFAGQSAFAAAQHSAYYMSNSRKRQIQETQQSSVLGQPPSTASSRGFTASQPSAYNRSHGRNHNNNRGLQEFHTQQGLIIDQPYTTSSSLIGPMSIVSNPTNVVSEPSNSTLEESTTGASSENADSDECDSETSSRKASCISYTESLLSPEQEPFFSY
jgi:hypothetical protein